MKKLLIVALLLVALCGCVSQAKFVIPDPPSFHPVAIHPIEGGAAISNQDMHFLTENIMALYQYAEKMRKILEDLQKGQ